MRAFGRIVALVAVVASAALATAAVPSRAEPGTGMLVGRTLITYGCPGPARLGIACPRWSLFPHARMAIRQIGPSGRPLPQTVRLIVSDADAHFSVRLSSGDYLITPLPGQHTRGGKNITTHITADSTTRISVRYLGYPQMV